MALNAAMARMAEASGGMKATRMAAGGFEELALPVAVRKGMGIIAMKVFAQDQIVGAASIEKLLVYSLSLPVSLASVGMPKARVHRAKHQTRPILHADVRCGSAASVGFHRGRTQGVAHGVLSGPPRCLTIVWNGAVANRSYRYSTPTRRR